MENNNLLYIIKITRDENKEIKYGPIEEAEIIDSNLESEFDLDNRVNLIIRHDLEHDEIHLITKNKMYLIIYAHGMVGEYTIRNRWEKMFSEEHKAARQAQAEKNGKGMWNITGDKDQKDECSSESKRSL